MSSYLFIDPGLMGTGVAYFNITEGETHPPEFWFVAHRHTSKWNVCAPYILYDVISGIWLRFNRRRDIDDVDADNLVIEFPAVWSTSSKSIASNYSGDLLKLSFLVGVLYQGLRVPNKYLVSPQGWKGQLPKDVVIQRIKKQWPNLHDIPDHAADAVGMGLFFQKGIYKLD